MSESYIFCRHCVKKQKQIDCESADRDDPSSTFRLYVVKFGPNVNIYFMANNRLVAVRIAGILDAIKFPNLDATND